MGQLQIPGTSVTYSNPLQKDQTTNISGVTGIGIGGVSTGSQGTGINSGDPQPGTFDATPVKANPILVNAQPKPLTDGGIKIPNSSCVVKNPA